MGMRHIVPMVSNIQGLRLPPRHFKNLQIQYNVCWVQITPRAGDIEDRKYFVLPSGSHRKYYYKTDLKVKMISYALLSCFGGSSRLPPGYFGKICPLHTVKTDNKTDFKVKIIYYSLFPRYKYKVFPG